MCHILGLLLQGIRVAVPAAIVGMLAGTDAVNAMLASIPPVITRGLQVSGGFIVVVGYAMVINMMNIKSLMPFFFIGFILAAFTNVNLIGFGAIGVICAIFHIQSIAKESKAAVAGGTDDIDDSDLM
jgi:PTS system mannose-specific IIC component